MSKRRQAMILTVAIAVSLLGSWTGWLPVDKAGAAIARPFGTGLTKLARRIGASFDEVGQLGSLRKQNDKLQAENAQLSKDNVVLQQLRQQNQQLREQLGLSVRADYKTVAADVISFAPDEIRQFVRINKGSDHGLGRGMVVASGNALVGVVNEVRATTSEVMLISDPEFRVLVSSADGRAMGIVKGQAGGSLSMERVPRDQPLKNDDLIISSGLDGSFPRGLEVGKVESVATSAEGIFQTAQLRGSADLKRIQVVQVIVDHESR